MKDDEQLAPENAYRYLRNTTLISMATGVGVGVYCAYETAVSVPIILGLVLAYQVVGLLWIRYFRRRANEYVD